MSRKAKMTKEEKKKLKDLEKQEKEMKKKNEARMKNRQKGLKAHKVCTFTYTTVCVNVK